MPHFLVLVDPRASLQKTQMLQNLAPFTLTRRDDMCLLHRCGRLM